MKTNGTGYLRQAFKLIEHFDPATLAAMKRAPWRIATGGAELVFEELMHAGIDPREAIPLAQHYDAGALGLTIQPKPGLEDHLPAELAGATWINPGKINLQAREAGLDLDHLTASVLVHEFDHYNGGGEPSAYTAGSRFAMRMGDYQLFAVSEATRKAAEQRELMERIPGLVSV